MKRCLSLLMSIVLLFSLFHAVAFAESNSSYDMHYYSKFKGKNMSINVYNWGQYIDDDTYNTNAEFEKLTGIKVNYTTYASNEEMYARLKSGGVHYDVVIPSDYMVTRLIEQELVEKIDFNNVPNYKYINKNFRNMGYDPKNEYSIPYTWGIVGILYNEKMVDEVPDSWDILWSEKYKGKILMIDNSRDAFGIALKKLGYSQNTTNVDELQRAADELIKQKPVLQAYVMDQIFDKMGSGEAALAPYYAGDSVLINDINPNVKFAVPKEGTNRFVDAACIPKGSQNKEAAEMYLNFLNEPEVACANAEYIGYSSPNDGAVALLPEETRNNPVIYPSEDVLKNTETFINLPEEINAHIDNLWVSVKGDGSSGWMLPVMLFLAVILSVFLNVRNVRKRKRERML